MTDRELLELAAKAAGLPVEFEEEVNGWYPCGRDEDGDVSNWWNPLIDDGDALRLAVKLKMGIHFETQFQIDQWVSVVEVYHSYDDDGACKCVVDPTGDDPCEATRRAIFRAASEIGRSME